MVVVFVPDLPEFMPLIEGARTIARCSILEPKEGYWRIESPSEIVFERKQAGLGPALWNSALTGGFRGRIVEFGRDRLRIASDD